MKNNTLYTLVKIIVVSPVHDDSDISLSVRLFRPNQDSKQSRLENDLFKLKGELSKKYTNRYNVFELDNYFELFYDNVIITSQFNCKTSNEKRHNI